MTEDRRAGQGVLDSVDERSSGLGALDRSFKVIRPSTSYLAATLLSDGRRWGFSFQSNFAGFLDGQGPDHGVELREPSLVYPEKMISYWDDVGQSWIVVNEDAQLAVYLRLGGHALLAEDLAHRLLAEFIKPQAYANVGPMGFSRYDPQAREAQQRRPRPRQKQRILERDGHICDYLHAIIAVPNPARGTDAPRHLIGWRLRSSAAAKALAVARSADFSVSKSEEPNVEWTYVDDQRPELAVRRDRERPVSVYEGSTVAVWGCGALGSWIAESLVRAGARKVILRDPGYVTRGLLVRQNYTEEDIGRPKAEALAERLSLLSDICEVKGIAGPAQTGLREDADTCDFIFDTSINTAVNAALDDAQKQGTVHASAVQAATDNQTATLGIVTVTSRTKSTTTAELDEALRRQAASDPSLAAFRTFWDPNAHPPLTPAPGCSVPTFHGSAADVMGIAASVISAAAIALSRQITAAYLLSLPHSPLDAPALTPVQTMTMAPAKIA